MLSIVNNQKARQTCQNGVQRQGQGNLGTGADEIPCQHHKVRDLCMVLKKFSNGSLDRQWVSTWGPLPSHHCRTTLEDGWCHYLARLGTWSTEPWHWPSSVGEQSCGMQTGCTARWTRRASVLQDLWVSSVTATLTSIPCLLFAVQEKTRCSLHH